MKMAKEAFSSHLDGYSLTHHPRLDVLHYICSAVPPFEWVPPVKMQLLQSQLVTRPVKKSHKSQNEVIVDDGGGVVAAVDTPFRDHFDIRP